MALIAPPTGEALNDLSPLLGRIHTHANLLPDILLAISSVANTPADEVDCEQFHFRPFANYALQTAFKLVVLLQLRRNKLQPVYLSDVFEAWSSEKFYAQEAKVLEEKAVDVWNLFIQDYRSIREIETVLWSQFPAQQGKVPFLRVVDFLVDYDSPALIVSHPIVMSGLANTWQHGFYLASSRDSGPLSALQCYDTFANPRSSHFIELFSHVGFLALLSHYLLHPYEKPHTWNSIFEYFGWRECFLVLLPFSFVMRTFSAIFLLVPLSFLLSLPFPPSPGDLSFTVLLWAFFLHVLQLHLPNSPSPLFLLSKHHTLPFAVFLVQRLSSILYPVILFFLPTILLASFLLSISLMDAFGQLLICRSIYGNLESPSPTESRLAFFTFFITVIGLAVFSAFALATSPDAHVKDTHSWDQYSEQIGLAARRSYYRAIRLHSGTYQFPPPFNILQLLFIQAPGLVFKTRLPQAEKILWRIIVGPFAIFSALLFALGNPKSMALRLTRTSVEVQTS